jgi:hypothetical protein
MKRIFKSVVAIIVLIPLITFITTVLCNTYKNHPRNLNEYWGIRLGDKAEDVLFYKGKPTGVYEDLFEKYSINNISKTVGIDIINKDFKPSWEYEQNDVEYIIQFTDDKVVKKVICECVNEEQCQSFSCPKVSTIEIGSSYEDIIKIFGYPAPEFLKKRYGLRFLKYPKYNVVFRLKKNKVYAITYEDPDIPLF